MAIYIDSCKAQDTIVITTRSSVYELVFVRADRGDVLVRGGRYFTKFSPVVFLGSIADDGSFNRDTIDVGGRLKFVFGEQLVITSPVESLSRDSTGAISPECAAVQ
jgi:hypothetical protein